MNAADHGGGGLHIQGAQHAAVINNAGRDQTIGVTSATFSAEALSAMTDVRSVVEAARLTGTERQQAERALDNAADEASSTEPDRGRVAAGVQKALAVLQEAGELAQAGAALGPPVQQLVRWLGPSGAALLGMLA